jgi:hypothetical protein
MIKPQAREICDKRFMHQGKGARLDVKVAIKRKAKETYGSAWPGVSSHRMKWE